MGLRPAESGRLSHYDLRYALAHEIGHTIGLDHPGPSGQLMSFRYEERFHGLQPKDVAGLAALYGHRPPELATHKTMDQRDAGTSAATPDVATGSPGQ